MNISGLDPTAYQSHFIHGQDRRWGETNCHVDVVIELLHALGHDPVAALAPCVSADFEGDQWTFYKTRNTDLHELYGIQIEELNPWCDLVGHIAQQVRMGRPVLIEVDSYHLPDTQGTAYGAEHVKTTIAVTHIDAAAKVLHYFHGPGFFTLTGADFDGALRVDNANAADLLPYIEFLKLRAPLRASTLQEHSLALLAREAALMPQRNPFAAFKEQFMQDWDFLAGQSIDFFHKYAFATFRQFGACFELAETYLTWIQPVAPVDLAPAADAFGEISETAKTIQFQLARAMARNKPLPVASLDSLVEKWDRANLTLSQIR